MLIQVSYVKRKLFFSTLAYWSVLLFSFFGLFLSLIFLAEDVGKRIVERGVSTTVMSYVIIILVYIFIFWRLRAFIEKIYNLVLKPLLKIKDEYRNYKKGIWAEKEVVNYLEKNLSGDYRLYSNFQIPGKNFDIDVLIARPGEVIIIEVKNYKRNLIFKEGKTFRDLEYCIYPITLEKDPRVQLDYYANEIEKYCKDTQRRVKVKKILLFFNKCNNYFDYRAMDNYGLDIVYGLENLLYFVNR